MLRKPALQYPHAEVVNPNEKVDFQCELQSSGKIAKARLMIDDNNYEYYFDNFDIQNLQENNYSSLVTYPIKNNIPTYKIYKSDNNRTSDETTFSFAAGEMYTWKMRIYEDDTKFNEDDTKSNYVPSSWIGKVTVMEILSGAESAGSNQGTYYGLNSSEMNGNRHDMMKMRTTILRLGIRLQKSKNIITFCQNMTHIKKTLREATRQSNGSTQRMI